MAKRNVPEDGWTKEGEAWFNGLDWEDAQFLLTRPTQEYLAEEDEEQLARIRKSYEDATGETWE